MSEHAKSARAAMKAKAKRLGSAGDPKAHVDASSWTPPEMENAGAKTGMRPISPRAYKRGGKVMHVEGDKAHHHAGRKPRKAGGKAEMPLVDRFINADRKKANLYRKGGDAHTGGYAKGGKIGRKMMTSGEARQFFDRMYESGDRERQAAEEARLRTPQGEAERQPRNAAMLGRMKEGSGYKRGGATMHDDEAADRALVKKMVKGSALTGKKHGGEAGGEKWIAGAIKHPGALHKALHVPEGKKIPAKKLEKATHSDNPKLAKRANLAKTLKRMHKKDGGFSGPSRPSVQGAEQVKEDSDFYKDAMERARQNVGPSREVFEAWMKKQPPIPRREESSSIGPEQPMPLPSRKRGGKAEHGAGCRCHKCMGGRMGKAEGGKTGDIGGERPKGGRVARATGGRAKGKTNVNIIISAGRPAMDGMGAPAVPGAMGGPGAAPAVLPRQAPVMPPQAAGAPPMGGMPMPPPQMPPQMPPPGAPMGRNAGGRVYRSYKDMDAGSGSGLGRLEKTEIEKHK